MTASFLSLPLRAFPAVLALALAAPLAAAPKVTPLTSFHYSGETETTGDGAKGWPSLRTPTSPPLLAVHPSSLRPMLFGGTDGQALRGIGSVGLWWMAATPGHYDRLAVDGQSIYGVIPGTPVRASDNSLYGVIVSKISDRPPAADTAQYASAVGSGLVFRTEFDGTHLEPVVSTRGKLFQPNGALVIDAQDNLYGIDKGPRGHGRIFKVTAAGAFEVVHEFEAGPNGMKQVANGLVLGDDGLLYGVTGYDRGIPLAPGTPTDPATPVGTVYRIDPAAPQASFRVLHTFTLAEGEINVEDNVTLRWITYYPSGEPYVIGTRGDVFPAGSDDFVVGLSSLVDGGDGWLYGTTSIPRCQVYSRYENPLLLYTPVAIQTPLCGYAHKTATRMPGAYPYYDGPMPHGAVYRLRKDGSGDFQILHRFSDADGSTPRGPLARGGDGNIYGTTLSGGANKHWHLLSSVWLERQPQCADIPLSSARNECLASGDPASYSTLVMADQALSNGALYRIQPAKIEVGTGGAVSASGFELLHSFKYNVDGYGPTGVSAGSDGRLYGTTKRGGAGYTNNRGEWVAQDDNGAAFMVDLDGEAPAASITLTVTPGEIPLGSTATLTWTSFQTQDCVASSSNGEWTGPVDPAGSVTLSPATGTFYYTLQCKDAERPALIVSEVVTLYSNAPLSGTDGNKQSYGNGGGALSMAAMALLVLAGGRRRHRRMH